MPKRRLPANVVSPTEFGKRRELRFAREVNMTLHPASGAGRIKADMHDALNVVEYKSVPTAASHSIKAETLRVTLREAERRGSEAWYIVEFEGVRLEGRIVRG
jgi:hypothetical protein